MHDSFRKKGSFRATFKAAEILRRNGIQVSIMTTVSKTNANDIPNLTGLIVNAGIASCTFARYCPNSSDDFDVMFKPLEYKAFLEEMWKVYDELHGKGTRFPLKDHLWNLFLMEKKLFNPEPTDGIVVAGCGMAVSHLTVLADGTVYACRRFKSPVGKVPEQKFDELFLGSVMNQYRIPENYSKCCNCELYTYCRGCSAVSYCMTGSWKSPDPQCWK
jgi:radical SAM protein with 4Fe4S-binding SPASM domain